MIKHMEVTAKTVEEALAKAGEQLGIRADKLQYTVSDEGRKGFLGMGASDAVIDVRYELGAVDGAKEFLETFLSNAGFGDAKVVETEATEDGETALEIIGENLGLIIGRHGETLDSLQYLANLAANRQNKGYSRITVDVEKYRAKRVETLNSLAARTASRVKKSGRSFTLEPMNPYERRIIHARVQKIEGVTTYSIGAGDERRVVVAPEGQQKISDTAAQSPSRRNRRGEASKKKPAETSQKPQIKYEYNPVREPKKIVKLKSLDELGLADVEDTETVIFDN
ncbi:MAG: protein jag [Firmicutes bacterium]|nr:protein jag [Bacillota bacterium]